MLTELEMKIAHHERESCKWTAKGKEASTVSILLLCIENANNESKEVARLVAKKNGWGETLINLL
tara:strand:+ start:149 stop:343 length:195 start_codon:yes stop_codon:yes gene_type:complete